MTHHIQVMAAAFQKDAYAINCPVNISLVCSRSKGGMKEIFVKDNWIPNYSIMKFITMKHLESWWTYLIAGENILEQVPWIKKRDWNHILITLKDRWFHVVNVSLGCVLIFLQKLLNDQQHSEHDIWRKQPPIK